VIGLSWCAELASVWLPIWLLGAAQLAPLCWLAVLRRADVPPLFLLLLVAWVGYTYAPRGRHPACLLSCLFLACHTDARRGRKRALRRVVFVANSAPVGELARPGVVCGTGACLAAALADGPACRTG
jgi:hypothetical protein